MCSTDNFLSPTFSLYSFKHVTFPKLLGMIAATLSRSLGASTLPNCRRGCTLMKTAPLKVLCGTVAGWWFGTFFIFPYIGNNHPNWLIFFRGVQTTNQVGFIEAPTIGMRDFPGDWREPRAGNRKHLEYSPNHYRVAPKPFQINCSHKARQFSLYQFIWRFP